MSITSRINEMSSHIEQAYDELQGLGADLTNVNKNIENISMVLDDIYDSLPSVSGEGTSLTLDDTRVGKIKSTLKGNTSQTGTPTPSSPIPVNVVSGDNEIVVCGKNLLGFENGTYTNNQGIVAIVDNGKITLNGTGTANPSGVTIPLTNTITIPSNVVYNLSAFNNSTNSNVSLRLQAIESSNPYTNVTLSTTNANATIQANSQYKVDRLYIRCNQGTTLSNFIIQPQIEKGSTASEYEPYQGNTYNINLPVENLFDKDNANVLNNFINSGTQKVDTSNNTRSIYIPCVPNTTYCVSKIKTARYAIGTTSEIPATNVSLIDMVFNNDATSLTLTTSSSAKYLMVYFYNSNYDTQTYQDIMNTIQIEYGSKPNTYTPYGTTPIELCKIGNYQDYFYKDSGKWYLHKEIERVVLNGSERGWGRSGSSSNDVFVGALNLNQYGIGIYSKQSTASSWLVNRFSYGTLGALNKFNVYNPDATYGYNNIGFGISTDIVNDIDAFKTWVSSNNIVFHYLLATPTSTEITYQPLIDQLNELEKAMSKDGQTNITQENNDLPFIISASALKEWSV